MNNLSHTPVSNGNTYCAPFCGRGCTYSEFDIATAEANQLVIELGEGWKSRVWENLGWHYEAKKSFASVIKHRDKYTCYFNTPQKQFISQSSDAKSAVSKCILHAKKYVHALNISINEFR